MIAQDSCGRLVCGNCKHLKLLDTMGYKLFWNDLTRLEKYRYANPLYRCSIDNSERLCQYIACDNFELRERHCTCNSENEIHADCYDLIF